MENLPSQILKINFGSSSENKIAQAIQNGIRIRDYATNEELKQVLRYVFTLIGLRPEQIPSELEKTVLINFITDNYGNYAPEEIRIAFELAIKKEFEAKTEHFGIFSSLYFANIMNSYQESRNKVAIQVMKNQAKIESQKEVVFTEKEIEETQKEYDLNVINPILQFYEQYNKLNFGLTSVRLVYNSLIKKHKILVFSEEDKKQIKEEARINHELFVLELEHQKSNNFQEHKMKELLLETFAQENKAENSILDECFKICIKRAFDKMIKEKINL